MSFVKLDCGMLDSTTWFDKDARDIFITALLMAVPREISDAPPQLEIRSLDPTGWIIPPDWYGFVDAASTGIINRCCIPTDKGMDALERLGAPESQSRSQKHDGRRMVRVDGGFIILNYDEYRAKDHTAAERQRRYRARQKEKRNAVTSRYDTSQPRNVTQAEAEAEEEAERSNNDCTKAPLIVGPAGKDKRAYKRVPKTWEITDNGREHAKKSGMGSADLVLELERFRDYEWKHAKVDFNACWRTWCKNWMEYHKNKGSTPLSKKDLSYITPAKKN